MAKALTGLRILDLTHILSGPFGTMTLADLGAEVIKIEPLEGERTRGLLAQDPKHSIEGMGAYFINLNRNKKSVALDLKSEDGRAIFYELVKTADIVFDNFSVGVTQKLAIDYARLSEINPRVITCSITGFGSEGPGMHRTAFDQVVQAYGGGMSITGDNIEQPQRAGLPIADLGGSLYGMVGVLTALYERERSGQGQHVDISMLDGQVAMLSYMATMYFLSGEDPEPIGNSHFVHVPYNSFKTADGSIVIAIIFDHFWEGLLAVLDCDELRKPEFDHQPGRLANKTFIENKVGEVFVTNTSAHWLELLEAQRIPCAPVNTFSQALSDSQVLHRNMVVDLPHPNGQLTRGPGNPVKLSRTNEENFEAAPLIGQHTDDVLGQLLGYDAAKLMMLRKQKIIG
ncbi:MAG TPA: acyl-CoA transferase [Porticoccaceae bacterium]|nr:acyl-CoA transferase [Porticoccaceae bacterium]HCO60532.1 acyl-CoA transferase [Porticoccaceae bacterium]